MIVQPLPERLDVDAAGLLLSSTLHTMEQCSKDFNKLCQEFGEQVGHSGNLHLGWGISRGKVKKLKKDYVGHNVNKAARLCGEARPFGIIVDRDDFPILPADRVQTFFQQERYFKGIDKPVHVWVTKEIATQFVTREFLRETPEVHVAGMCIGVDDKELRFLLARRSAVRKLYPGLIEGCGGQLARSETFVDAVNRHFRLEMGIEIEVRKISTASTSSRSPTSRLSQESVFSAARWMIRPRSRRITPRCGGRPKKDFRRLSDKEFVGELKADVLKLIAIFKQQKNIK